MQLLGYVYITVALVILGSVGDNYAHLVLIIKDSAGSFPDGWTCVKFFSFLLSVRFFFFRSRMTVKFYKCQQISHILFKFN